MNAAGSDSPRHSAASADILPAARPWYRETAPWLLMAGPAVVIIAGAVTLWLALSRPDRLVADDYYKRGLLVERRIDHDRAASKLRIGGSLTWDPAGHRLILSLSRMPETQEVPSLLLRHVSRSDLDRRLALTLVAPATFAAALEDLPPGGWDVIVETEQWRIEGHWLWPQQPVLRLGGE